MSAHVRASNDRRGMSMVVTVAGFFGLIGMVALAVDIGHIYTQQRRWQNAVDSAAVAGYQQLQKDKANGGGVAASGLYTPAGSDCPGSSGSSAVSAKGLAGYSATQMSRVIMSFGKANGFDITDDMITFGSDRITISGPQTIPLFVAPVLGLNNVEVRASQTVVAGKAATNVAATIPIGMPHGDVQENNGAVTVASLPTGEFEVGKEYILKVGSGGDNKDKILIPMDTTQGRHLLAYGVAYWALGTWTVDWLINYRGGSFMLPYDVKIVNRLTARGVTHSVLKVDPCKGLDEVAPIYASVAKVISCFDKPKIGVYSSQNPDPVMAILQEAEIPYGDYAMGVDDTYNPASNTYFFDTEIRAGILSKYDWLHLHHEDFRKGRLDIANLIRAWVASGHHMYTQCLATETLDVALAQDAQAKGSPVASSYGSCFAFENFFVTNSKGQLVSAINDKNSGAFTLLDLDDPRCQNHTTAVAGFGGATTSFAKQYMKTGVKLLAEVNATTAKYLTAGCGTGQFTFLAGHQQADLPGKRLVLNNILLGSQSPSVLARARSHFGPVELDPADDRSGAGGYEDDFIFGNVRDIKSGLALTTLSGNLSSQTKKASALRYAGDPGSTPAKVAANSSRVVNVPIVKPAMTLADNSGAAQIYDYKKADSVQVTGMAQFLIHDVTTKAPARTDNGPVTDGQVRGVFLKYVSKPTNP